MQIKVSVYEESTNVQVRHPDGEVYVNEGLEPGEEIVLTATPAHEPSDIEVGQITVREDTGK